MKKLSVVSLILMFVFIGCQYDPAVNEVFYVTNATSKNVKYIDKKYNREISLPVGEKTEIIKTGGHSFIYPEGMNFGNFIFDDTLTLQYSINDTFARNIYKKYETEKIVDKRHRHECFYNYTLTEEDFQNALQQNQR